MGFPGGSAGKESACNVGDLGLTPGLEISPEEGRPGFDCWVGKMPWRREWLPSPGKYSSILAWRIPWPVQPMGSQRVGHD